jgi:hypothetical protein
MVWHSSQRMQKDWPASCSTWPKLLSYARNSEKLVGKRYQNDSRFPE